MTSKKCNGCGEVKDSSEYYKGRVCKTCIIKKKNARRKNIVNWLKQYKRNSKCCKCGYSKETHPNFTYKALEFHHPQGNKEFNIANTQAIGVGFERLKKEIDKCVVLCSRCHVEIHNK